MNVKIGDLLVVSTKDTRWEYGILMGFNKKGEGGKDFVHVLINGPTRHILCGQRLETGTCQPYASLFQKRVLTGHGCLKSSISRYSSYRCRFCTSATTAR